MSGEGGLHLNAAPPSSSFLLTVTVANGTSSRSSIDLGFEESVIGSSLDVACGCATGKVGPVAASEFAHVGGADKSSGEPMVLIDGGSNPGCGDATPGDSAAARANDNEYAGHTIEAVSSGSALGEGVSNGWGAALTAGCKRREVVDAALLALPWRLGYIIRVLVTQMSVRRQYRHPCDSHILNSEQAHLRPSSPRGGKSDPAADSQELLHDRLARAYWAAMLSGANEAWREVWCWSLEGLLLSVHC